MIISSSQQAYLAAQTRSSQRTDPSDSASAGPQAPAQDTGYTTPNGAPVTGAAPLSGMHILSRIQTTLPNGLTLAMFRFDLGNGLDTSSADAAAGASQPTPTIEDKRADEAMLKSFMQMVHGFNDNPSASDIQLEGTAAVDLDLQTDLKA